MERDRSAYPYNPDTGEWELWAEWLREANSSPWAIAYMSDPKQIRAFEVFRQECLSKGKR